MYKRQVVGDRHVRDQTLVVTVLRHEPGAGRQRVGHAARPRPAPRDLDHPGRGRPQSDDGLRHLGAPAAGSAGQADDLPRADVEAHVPVRVIGAGEVAHAQRGRPGGVERTGPFPPAGHLVVAGHGSDQVGSRQAGHRRGHDVPGVPEDRHQVADLVDLRQMVADEQERHPLRLQVADPVEQPGDSGAVEPGRRLVEDDETGAERQRPGDLHELPLLHRQVTGRGPRVDLHRPPGEQLGGAAVQRRPSDQAGPATVVPVEEEVLGHTQPGDDRRLLVDAGHPLAPGVPVGEPRRGPAAELHRVPRRAPAARSGSTPASICRPRCGRPAHGSPPWPP